MPNSTRKRVAPKHSAAGRRLIASARQALAWAKGENVPGVRVTVVKVTRTPVIDVRILRKKLGLSQSQFAERFGFTPATLRNWEQGRREPTGPAQALLRAIHNDPENVIRALERGAHRTVTPPLRRREMAA